MNPQPKFKPGDRVWIKIMDIGISAYKKYEGTYATIREVKTDGDHGFRHYIEEVIGEDEDDFYWYGDELELVVEDPPLETPSVGISFLFEATAYESSKV
jgi:hypothetical protein